MELLGLLVIVIIIGALVGGDTLGETIRFGCGALLLIVAGFIVFVWLTSPGTFGIAG